MNRALFFPLTSLIIHFNLVWQLTKREVIGRYRGSILGILWSFFNPLFMLTVYTLVFGEIFGTRWRQGASESTSEFAVVLFAGLVVHGFFSEVANRAPNLIVGNPNYVKRVVFPLEVLPWVAIFSALFHTGVSIVVLIGASWLVYSNVNWTMLFIPLILLPLVLLTVGIAWFLSSLGVFLRDVGQTVGLITAAMMFLSPIFYPVSALPERLRPIIYANPLTFVIEQVRAAVVWKEAPNWEGLAIYLLAGFVVAVLGGVWFQKTRRGFADVM